MRTPGSPLLRRRSRPSSRGVTLVELLITIGVICVLIGLALPAIQAAREVARGARCAANLKQIGIASHAYESLWGSSGVRFARVPDAIIHALRGSLRQHLKRLSYRTGSATFVLRSNFVHCLELSFVRPRSGADRRDHGSQHSSRNSFADASGVGPRRKRRSATR
jgi:prepilin-type N-terminal cleavage/methylation domain-containing protein